MPSQLVFRDHDPGFTTLLKPFTPFADVSPNILLAGGNPSLDPRMVAQGCPCSGDLLWIMLNTGL